MHQLMERLKQYQDPGQRWVLTCVTYMAGHCWWHVNILEPSTSSRAVWSFQSPIRTLWCVGCFSDRQRASSWVYKYVEFPTSHVITSIPASLMGRSRTQCKRSNGSSTSAASQSIKHSWTSATLPQRELETAFSWTEMQNTSIAWLEPQYQTADAARALVIQKTKQQAQDLPPIPTGDGVRMQLAGVCTGYRVGHRVIGCKRVSKISPETEISCYIHENSWWWQLRSPQTLPDESEDLEGFSKAPTTPVKTPPIDTTPSVPSLRWSQRARKSPEWITDYVPSW